MEPTQILLIVVVSILTVILTIIGYQLYLILGELKNAFRKINKMLDNGLSISETISKSVTGVAGVVSGIKTGLSVFNIFKKEKEENGEEE